jgi:hypothetical protein
MCSLPNSLIITYYNDYLTMLSIPQGLERGPLSLVSTTEELLDRKVAAV